MNYLTAKDIMARLKISKSAAHKIMRSIPHYKGIGGIRCTQQAFDDYLANQTQADEPKLDILPMPAIVRSGHFAGLAGN